MNINDLNPQDTDVIKLIKESEGEESLKSKVSFANLLNCKYSFVLYSYQPKKVLVYNITDQNIVFSKQYDNILSFSLDLLSIGIEN